MIFIMICPTSFDYFINFRDLRMINDSPLRSISAGLQIILIEGLIGN